MFLNIIIIVFSLLISGLIVGWYYQYFRLARYYAKYNGPSPIPIFGNMHKIWSNLDVIPVITEFHKKYGSVIKMWFGYSPRLMVSDHRIAELLLQSNTILDKSYDYKYLHPWLGTGLLTSTGSKWKRQRRLLTPTFHFKILEQYISTFNTQSDILVKMLQKNTNAGPFNIYPFINLWALDVVCETAMGIQIHAQTGGAVEYIDAVAEATDIVIRRIFSAIKCFNFVFKMSPDYQKQKLQKKELEALTKNSEDVLDILGKKKRLTFLDLLLQCKVDGEPLPQENIREEVDTFMFEGHDTVTSAVSFILYCLSQNLDVQDKVVKEFCTIFNYDKIIAPSYKELQEMKYLEATIKESMRLYPPVPLIARTLLNNTEFDGTIFKKGSAISIFVYGLHRQEAVFPDPEKFIPDRFFTGNCAERSPFAYIPFSAGSRNCIGQRFAMLELKSVISKLVRNFEILPAPGYEPILAPDAVLRTANGVQVRLKQRNI